MGLLRPTRTSKPDAVEATLVVTLAIWVVSVLWLINMGLSQNIISQLTIDSLTMFFAAFSSIVFLVIAVLLANIRKELRGAV